MTQPDFEASKISNEDGGAEDRLFDWDKKMFAVVRKDIFSANYNVDAAQVAQNISQINEYESIKNIVKQERAENFPAMKKIYKVKRESTTNNSQLMSSSKFISIRVKP